jgi:nucleoside-diphosphate-sugar epimerase
MVNCVVVIGSDGYIGNALVQRLLRLNYNVIGIDNFIRRVNILKSKSKSAIDIMEPLEKIKELAKLGRFSFHRIDIAKEADKISQLIERYTPIAVVNLGHIPSGPWSMIDRDHSCFTLMNNMIGTNNVLWAIKEKCPDCHYITIGSTGEYDHYNNIDIEEGYFSMEWNNRKSTEMIFPRRPGSIYHVSKTSSTYLIDFLTRSWDLYTTDVMQSVVFGAYTDEIDKSKIYSRFDTDESHGTVLNRFICQAKSNLPLTIYGKGEHKRGFLSLNDSIQALMIAIKSVPKKGRTQVWNQLSEWHSMNEIANMVQQVGAKLGYDVKTTKIKTPRNESTEDHYYNYKTDILKNFGYKPTRTIKEEIEYCFNIVNKGDFVNPKIMWK